MPECIYNLDLLTVFADRFLKTKKEYNNSKKHFYQNELDKACFQHDMPHGDFKDLP